jgi:catechol 2,3-dioxygenase-like lactoylglutathione lyase family enzyme
MSHQGFIEAFHHCGLVVRDLDRSIYLYRDIVGLPFAKESTGWLSGPALEAGVMVPGASLRQVASWAGEHSLMELIEYGNRPESSTRQVPNNYLAAAAKYLGERPSLESIEAALV